VGKRQLKERCGLEPRTNVFPFKKLPKTECGLGSRIYGMSVGYFTENLERDLVGLVVCIQPSEG
jgi:hypothetical protein